MSQDSGISRRQLIAASALAGLAPCLMTLADAHAQGIAPKRGGTLNALLVPEPPILILGVNSQGPTLIAASRNYAPDLTGHRFLLKLLEKSVPRL